MTNTKTVSHSRAVLLLIAATALWGTSFATIKVCGEVLVSGSEAGTSAGFGPVLLTALRFTISLIIILAFWKGSRNMRFRRGEWGPLLRVSVPMAAAFLVQGAGLAYTTATLSGFITGLCVCFTPGFEWVLLGRRPTWRLAAGVTLALGGVSLMALTGGGGGGALGGFGLGELLTFICVLIFTVQIIYTGQSAERLGAARLTSGSFAFTAVCAWGATLVMAPGSVTGAVAAAAVSGKFWGCFTIIVVCATLAAMILVNVFQRYVRPSEAAVVYTSEPLFASLFALLIIGKSEMLGAWGLVGAGAMLAANLIVALRPRRRKKEINA